MYVLLKITVDLGECTVKCKHRDIMCILYTASRIRTQSRWKNVPVFFLLLTYNSNIAFVSCSISSGTGAQDWFRAQGRSRGEQILVRSHITHCLLVISGYCSFPSNLHVQTRPRRYWQSQFRHYLNFWLGMGKEILKQMAQNWRFTVELQYIWHGGFRFKCMFGFFPVSKEQKWFVFKSTL